MIETAFHFCPRCGKELQVLDHHGETIQGCGACGYTHFKNQNVTVSGVLITDGQILFVKRARNPFLGMIDIPGGFVNPNEAAKDAIVREMKEELNVDVVCERLFGMYGPDYYPYNGIDHYNGCVIYEVKKISGKLEVHDDVAALCWYDLGALPDPKECAFASHQQFIAELQSGKVTL